LINSGIAPRIGRFRRIQWRFSCLDGCLASRLRHWSARKPPSYAPGIQAL
jgi:hypothetical protein